MKAFNNLSKSSIAGLRLPLIHSALLDVYEKYTGEQIIGGGTFGRHLKRGVAYSAMFEGEQDTMTKPTYLNQLMHS